MIPKNTVNKNIQIITIRRNRTYLLVLVRIQIPFGKNQRSPNSFHRKKREKKPPDPLFFPVLSKQIQDLINREIFKACFSICRLKQVRKRKGKKKIYTKPITPRTLKNIPIAYNCTTLLPGMSASGTGKKLLVLGDTL